MGDTDSVFGLTLAELAFFLLFAGILLFLAGNPLSATAEESGALKKQLAAMEETLAEAREAREAMEAELAEAEVEVARLQDKRSTQTPTCREQGLITRAYLFRLVVVGEDSYRILPTGPTVNMQGLRDAYSVPLSEANEAGCNHNISVYFDQDMSTKMYYQEMKRLNGYFYANPSGEFQETR